MTQLYHDGVSYRDSKHVKYNDILQLNVASLYGGLLQDEQFMQDVCLKKERVITIPDAPDGVSDCILTRGDQENDEFTAPGQTHSIPLEIWNPEDEERITIAATVYEIETCPPKTTTATSPSTTSPSDPSPKLGGVQSAIIFTVSILGTNLAVALIATTVCWMKKRKRRAAVAQVQLDVNPMYGTVYYHLDR